MNGTIPFGLQGLWAASIFTSKQIILRLNGNNFEGELPEFAPALFLFVAVFDISMNPLLQSPNETLPSAFSPNLKPNAEKTLYSRNYQCPQISSSISDIQTFVRIDPEYYNFSLCECIPNYYGIAPVCNRCLEFGKCIAGGTQIGFEKNYFPVFDENSLIEFVPCHLYNYNDSPCNKKGICEVDLAHQQIVVCANLCEEGYTGRLCSR